MELFYAKDKLDRNNRTPNMNGYQPDKDWWPDLTDYRKLIFVYDLSPEKVRSLLEQYTPLASGNRKIVYDFKYTVLPEHEKWILVECPEICELEPYRNVLNYQYVATWIRKTATRVVCLAAPKDPDTAPLFLTIRDNAYTGGNAMTGVCWDRDFKIYLDDEIFEWGPVPTSAFDMAGYLRVAFHINIDCVTKLDLYHWEVCKVTVCNG